VNKFKSKENVKNAKEKNKTNVLETSKQQVVSNQMNNPQQMNYNVIYEFIKLRIIVPFMEFVKIP